MLVTTMTRSEDQDDMSIGKVFFFFKPASSIPVPRSYPHILFDFLPTQSQTTNFTQLKVSTSRNS